MAERFACPACGQGLRVPAGCDDSRLTCPRCLADIPNPAAGTFQAAPPLAAGGAIREAPAPRWVARPPDVAVRRDQRGTSVGLILLAVLGGVGLLLLGLPIGLSGLESGTAAPLVVLVGILLFFALISAVWVYGRGPAPTGARGIGRVIVGTLAITGVVFAVLVLLAVAAVIVLFVVCFSGGGPKF
jgi:hypothetical protein